MPATNSITNFGAGAVGWECFLEHGLMAVLVHSRALIVSKVFENIVFEKL